jgi:hypothetical protein
VPHDRSIVIESADRWLHFKGLDLQTPPMKSVAAPNTYRGSALGLYERIDALERASKSWKLIGTLWPAYSKRADRERDALVIVQLVQSSGQGQRTA